MLLSDMGNWADDRLDEGCRVSSVASREMAAGLSTLSVSDVIALELLQARAMDQSHHAARFTSGRSVHGPERSAAVFAGTAVFSRKHDEIIFGGAESSCYPWYPIGAEGFVTSTSRRPK